MGGELAHRHLGRRHLIMPVLLAVIFSLGRAPAVEAQNLDVVFANNQVCLGDGMGGFSSCADVSPDTNTSFGVALGELELSCAGDCDGDGVVSVSELIRGVFLMQGDPTEECRAAFDANSDGRIRINEVVRAVRNSLLGCA